MLKNIEALRSRNENRDAQLRDIAQDISPEHLPHILQSLHALLEVPSPQRPPSASDMNFGEQVFAISSRAKAVMLSSPTTSVEDIDVFLSIIDLAVRSDSIAVQHRHAFASWKADCQAASSQLWARGYPTDFRGSMSSGSAGSNSNSHHSSFSNSNLNSHHNSVSSQRSDSLGSGRTKNLTPTSSVSVWGGKPFRRPYSEVWVPQRGPGSAGNANLPPRPHTFSLPNTHPIPEPGKARG
jgi:hypothetical protein